MDRSKIVVLSAVILTVMVVLSIAIVVLSFFIPWHSIDVDKIGPANQVWVYNGGTRILVRPIVVGSASERAVTSWMRSHRDGWQLSLVSYAPVRCVRGANFNLNFRKNRCVLNYRVGDRVDRMMQVVR